MEKFISSKKHGPYDSVHIHCTILLLSFTKLAFLSLSLSNTPLSLSPPSPLKAHKCVRIPHSSTDNEIFDELALPNRTLIFTGSGMIQSAQDVNNSCI
jgi:hypothetical protein